MDVLLTAVVLLLASNAVHCCSVTKILPSEASINVTFETDVTVACRIDNCQHVHALYNYTLNETKKEGWIDLPNCMDLDVSLRECKSSRNFTNEQFNQTHLWCQFKNSRSTATQILIQSHLDQVRNVSLIRKSAHLFLTWKSPQNLLSGLTAAYHVILSVGDSTLFNETVDDLTSVDLTNRSIDGWLPIDPCVAIDCNITAMCGTVESSMSHDILYYPTKPPFNDSSVDIRKTDEDNRTVAVVLTLTPNDNKLCSGNLPQSVNLSVSYKYAAEEATNLFGLIPHHFHGQLVIGKGEEDILLNGDDQCNMSIILTNAAGNFTLPYKIFSTFDVQEIRVTQSDTEYCLQCIFARNSKADGCAIYIDGNLENPVIKLQKKKGKFIRSNKKCLPKPSDRDHVEIFVNDIDSGQIESEHLALSQSIYFNNSNISAPETTASNLETFVPATTPPKTKSPETTFIGVGIGLFTITAIAIGALVVCAYTCKPFKRRDKRDDQNLQSSQLSIENESPVEGKFELVGRNHHQATGNSDTGNSNQDNFVKPEQQSESNMSNSSGTLVFSSPTSSTEQEVESIIKMTDASSAHNNTHTSDYQSFGHPSEDVHSAVPAENTDLRRSRMVN